MNNISLIESIPARATQVFGNKALNDQIPLLLLDNELGTGIRTSVNSPA